MTSNTFTGMQDLPFAGAELTVVSNNDISAIKKFSYAVNMWAGMVATPALSGSGRGPEILSPVIHRFEV
jgi:hypothetical protein